MKMRNFQAAQKKNIRVYAKHHREIAALLKKLKTADARRRSAASRILNEIEKDPSRYTHVIHKGRSRKSVPMTAALVRKFRKQMLQQQQPPKNPHGGPGCDDCEDIEDCWCAFKAGPFCCYLCLSLPGVIQCHW